MKFAVVNPGGRDKAQTFAGGPGSPRGSGHAPVNFHAYAACLGGGFFRDEAEVEDGVALLLLRKRNLRRVLAAIERLHRRGVKALVSCKETGSHQVAELLGDVTRWELFCAICSAADGVLTPVSALEEVYRLAGAKRVECVPTPYPLEFPEWDFGVPLEKRLGIFVGTREFGVPSRNHLAAVALADALSRELSCPLSVVNSEGRRGRLLLRSFQRRNPQFYIIEGPVAYAEYLELMARHRIVWQLDQSAVPGQVAGDALLCRMPCVGGNSQLEMAAFPGFCGVGERGRLVGLARELLSSDAAWTEAVKDSAARASQVVSFQAAASRLGDIFASLGEG